MIRRFMGGGKRYTPSEAPDGVYGVTKDLMLIDKASPFCIGVALIYRDHRFMIEKFEDHNQSYEEASTGKNSANKFYWGGYDTDQEDIMDYNTVDGSNSFGYLRAESGIYNGTPYLPAMITEWEDGALSDWDGYTNSDVLKTITEGGGSYTFYATIGHVLNTFLDGYDSIGYDWYIPSCAQLSLIYMYLTSINNALSAIGGQIFNTSNSYWSSSEYGRYYAWKVSLGNGNVDYDGKDNIFRVRFISDL